MGPLEGFKIIEIAGIGPGQFAGMLLADMGANLVRIDRPRDTEADFQIDPRFDILNRSRPNIGVDLKTKQGTNLVLDLCKDADAIFEICTLDLNSRQRLRQRALLERFACSF